MGWNTGVTLFISYVLIIFYEFRRIQIQTEKMWLCSLEKMHFLPCHTIKAGYYGITLAVLISVHPSVDGPSVCPSTFPFLDNNLRKCQWIFPKLGVCIDIVEFWFGIVNGQISSIFDRVICL